MTVYLKDLLQTLFLQLVLHPFGPPVARKQHWIHFRGSGLNGIAEADSAPVEWNDSNPFSWKTDISGDGVPTTWLLNKSDRIRKVRLTLNGAGNQVLYLYRVTEKDVMRAGFRMDPQRELITGDGKELILELPPLSISTLSGYKKLHEEPAWRH